MNVSSQIFSPVRIVASTVFFALFFGLFGLTAEARATYWRAFCFVGKQFGWKPAPGNAAERPTLETMEFGARPQEISLDAEMGCACCLYPRNVRTDIPLQLTSEFCEL